MNAPRALLLDLGGVVFRSGAEMLAAFGRHEPRARGVVARRGPLGPEPDELWERMLRQEISERDYWSARAAEIGHALGQGWDARELMDAIYGVPGEPLIRPVAEALIVDARAAGIAVGVLTNDLTAFHGEGAAARFPVLADLEVLVDASLTGVLKPDPRAYRIAAERMRRPPAEIVFLDDMPWNVTGAQEAGMIAVLVDLVRPELAFEAARQLLDLQRRAA